ncbi:unnamed protein product [Leptosia nina]|uniref:Uncharacterized protein n=1 Tax=Leptosia nina TaxID=320188 RepID=A0AAV1JZW2_9NEOP
MSSENTKKCSESTITSGESFIDDYSHLRFSYYQDGDPNTTLQSNSSFVTANDTIQTFVSDISVNERRERVDIPELPHPAFTMAAIIASASNRMNAGNMQFKYADKIETAKTETEALTFSPSRRSTMCPKKK